jgi:hypothetical protein
MVKLINQDGQIEVDFDGKFEDVIKELGSSLSFLLYDVAEKSKLEPKTFVREFLKQYKKVYPKVMEQISEYKSKKDNV